MLDLKIVPEYPDMVEENGILYQKLEVMDEEIRSYHERIEQLSGTIDDKVTQIASLNSEIKELKKTFTQQKKEIITLT